MPKVPNLCAKIRNRPGSPEIRADFVPEPLGIESIKRALGALESLHLDQDEREAYEARLKWLRDEEMAIQTAFNKGHKEGIEEGKLERTIAVARNMASEGIDRATITKVTGLTLEELNDLLD